MAFQLIALLALAEDPASILSIYCFFTVISTSVPKDPMPSSQKGLNRHMARASEATSQAQELSVVLPRCGCESIEVKALASPPSGLLPTFHPAL